jgi:hypothetical protein
MKRLLTVALLSLSFAGLGCPGNLDPSLEGGGGSTGTGGGGGGTPCDAPTVVLKMKCGQVICHDPSNLSSNAGLDFTKTSGYVAQLLGKSSQGINGSMCGSSSMPYLVEGSNPASGLLIDKLVNSPPSCGVQMPYGMTALSGSNLACVQSWALGITTGVITQ